MVLEEQFEYLGFQITVTPEGPKLSVPDSKREVFQRMELPTSRDGIRKILGMVTFIDLMIPGLHCHLGPLIDDLKIAIPKDKKKPLQITDIQERSFKYGQIGTSARLELTDTTNTVGPIQDK